MGSLRLPAAQVPELIRQTLMGVLRAPEALANVEPPPAKRTARLGLLRLQPELAERLSVVAQELGVSVAEVVRRAVATASQ